MASLAEIAMVKEESRGVVITLSGSVLLATAKSDLLPIAREKLDQVANALTDHGFKAIVVQGYTDFSWQRRGQRPLVVEAGSVSTGLTGHARRPRAQGQCRGLGQTSQWQTTVPPTAAPKTAASRSWSRPRSDVERRAGRPRRVSSPSRAPRLLPTSDSGFARRPLTRLCRGYPGAR